MKLIRQLLNRNIDEEQGNLDLEEKNLDVASKKLHASWANDEPYEKVFCRKPSSWNEVVQYAKSNGYILLANELDMVGPELVQDLSFDVKEVYGVGSPRPMHEFTREFQAKGLDAFYVDTPHGKFAVRTEGANYGRYVAYVAEDDDEMKDD